MKPERPLIAERILAQHCPELLRPTPAAGEMLPLLNRLGDRLSRSLATGLARLSGRDAPAVRTLAPRECTMAELAQDVGPLAANSLLATGAGHAPFLASIEASAVLSMVDRAFGGRGEVPSPLPESFPMSAELLIARLEGVVAAASSEALAGDAGPEAVRALRRDGSLAHLAAFGAADRLVVLTIEVLETAGAAPWKLFLAFAPETLAELIDQSDRTPAAPAGPRDERGPTDAPFADMPLPLTAVLVDMRIGFSALSALRPGDILPVAVARSVPIKIGDKTIAHGTIGEVDDRVAVQITTVF